MTPAELKAEFTNDPKGYGYAAATTQGKADLINQIRQEISISRRVPTPDLLRVMAAAPFRLASLPQAMQDAWKSELDLIRAIPDFEVADSGFQAILTQAVTDGVLNSAEQTMINSLAIRPGSRAEQLWGPGEFVTLDLAARAI